MKIVFLSAVRYRSVISGRTKQLALELARLGHVVFFVELPSIRNFRLPPFHLREEDGVHIVTLPPFPFSRRLMSTVIGTAWGAIAGLILKRSIPKLSTDVNMVISTPWWCRFVENNGFSAVAYDCIDHVSVHEGGKFFSVMEGWEQSLLRISRNIFIIRDHMAKVIPLNSIGKVHVVPNGVPSAWMVAGKSSMMLPPTGQKPRIGFVGSIYEWIDQDLIVQTARLLPDYQFILIGPLRREVSVERLRAEPNIELCPPIPFEKVPSAIRSFDVCMMPFTQDVISEWADPLKLYEYLAMGKPVVSTVNFNQEAPVFIGRTAAEFSDQIARALMASGEVDIARRQGFAAQYTWRKQAEKMALALES